MGKPITLKFEKEGLYIYECTQHVVMAMVGVIQVGKPSNLKQAQEFIKTYSEKFALNKNRLESYIEKLSQKTYKTKESIKK